MPKNVRFFEEPTVLSENVAAFNTIPKALKQAKNNPGAFISFIKKAFKEGGVQDGRHPVLEDLILFCHTLNAEAFDEDIPNENIIRVVDTIKPLLVTHYERFAITDPDACARRLKKEIQSSSILGKKHSILGDLKALYGTLPQDNLVFQLLYPIWRRAEYLHLANEAPKALIALLDIDFRQEIIQAGEHPLLGNMLSFAYDVEKYKDYYDTENAVTIFLKPHLLAHYQALAESNPSVCLKDIQQEDNLRHFKQNRHLIFGNIDTFIETLDDGKGKEVKALLINIQRLETLATKGICKPLELNARLAEDIKAGKVKDAIHEEYGDLRKLAQKIYEDAPEPAMEGKNHVLSLLELHDIWSYPPATHNPINGMPYPQDGVDPRQVAIDDFYKRQIPSLPKDVEWERERQEWLREHNKGTVRTRP